MEVEIGSYRHTQKGLWGPLCCFWGAGLVIVGLSATLVPMRITSLIAGIVMFPLGMFLHHLTVADKGSYLAIWFGPFPLFCKRLDYADIVAVEKGRTRILDGWGARGGLRGELWSIWGRDCVVIYLKRGFVLRVGTDDPDGLTEFLKRRTGKTNG